MHSAFVGKNSFVLIKMHGKTTIKIIDAQQAKLRNNHKNTRLKLLKTNAAIWFNKMCRIKQLNSAFVGKNSFVLIKMHGKTTILKNMKGVLILFEIACSNSDGNL